MAPSKRSNQELEFENNLLAEENQLMAQQLEILKKRMSLEKKKRSLKSHGGKGYWSTAKHDKPMYKAEHFVELKDHLSTFDSKSSSISSPESNTDSAAKSKPPLSNNRRSAVNSSRKPLNTNKSKIDFDLQLNSSKIIIGSGKKLSRMEIKKREEYLTSARSSSRSSSRQSSRADSRESKISYTDEIIENVRARNTLRTDDNYESTNVGGCSVGDDTPLDPSIFEGEFVESTGINADILNAPPPNGKEMTISTIETNESSKHKGIENEILSHSILNNTDGNQWVPPFLTMSNGIRQHFVTEEENVERKTINIGQSSNEISSEELLSNESNFEALETFEESPYGGPPVVAKEKHFTIIEPPSTFSYFDRLMLKQHKNDGVNE
eukprot:TRINITY_DN9775_c0_g1_i1.p1 TRINITY_DN9775_c0_g1~~TRINITY_DN9775_c0_g1_i1.p1  ORF type:complete len:389 (+),score=135.25 TRINITY_DN9775_c0_g1_i1:27-1169(+)